MSLRNNEFRMIKILIIIFILNFFYGCIKSASNCKLKVDKSIKAIVEKKITFIETEEGRCSDMFFSTPKIRCTSSRREPFKIFEDNSPKKRIFSSWIWNNDSLMIGTHFYFEKYSISIISTILDEDITIKTIIKSDIYNLALKTENKNRLLSVKKVTLESNCKNFEVSELPDSIDDFRIYGLIDIETESFFLSRKDTLFNLRLRINSAFQSKKGCL